jgi:hypothetical protein
MITLFNNDDNISYFEFSQINLFFIYFYKY